MWREIGNSWITSALVSWEVVSALKNYPTWGFYESSSNGMVPEKPIWSTVKQEWNGGLTAPNIGNSSNLSVCDIFRLDSITCALAWLFSNLNKSLNVRCWRVCFFCFKFLLVWVFGLVADLDEEAQSHDTNISRYVYWRQVCKKYLNLNSRWTKKHWQTTDKHN